MSGPPGMMFWTDAYDRDTKHLSTTEHGAYLLLIFAMWNAGGKLPNDRTRLARISRLTLDKWRRMEPTILAFFHVEGAHITHKRVSQELEIASCKVEKTRAAAEARWAAKRLKINEEARADALPEQCPSNETKTLDIEIEKEPLTSFEDKVGLAAELRRPDSEIVSDTIWQEFPHVLADLSGRSETAVRAWLGKLLKTYDHPDCLAALRASVAAGSGDPFGYVTRILTGKHKAAREGPRPDDRLDRNPFVQMLKETYDAQRNSDTTGPGNRRAEEGRDHAALLDISDFRRVSTAS